MATMIANVFAYQESYLRKAALALVALTSCTVLFAASPASIVSGDVSVATSAQRRSAVVTVVSGENTAQFCISFAKPLAAPLALQEKGEVIYTPQPIPGLPAGMKISGPELIAPAIAVRTAKGSTLLFTTGVSAPTGVDPKKAKTIPVAAVVRQDWKAPNGTQRGIGAEACLSAGG